MTTSSTRQRPLTEVDGCNAPAARDVHRPADFGRTDESVQQLAIARLRGIEWLVSGLGLSGLALCLLGSFRRRSATVPR